MITLPDINGNEGVETRVLLAECRGPAYGTYSFDAAKECMGLMDAVLWNRLENPRPFLAPHARDLRGIVTARGQFAGFEAYPNIDQAIKDRIIDILAIANNPADSRNASYVEFVNLAISTAKSAEFSDPSPGRLVAWRTARHSRPGRSFIRYRTLMGIDFFYQ